MESNRAISSDRTPTIKYNNMKKTKRDIIAQLTFVSSDFYTNGAFSGHLQKETDTGFSAGGQFIGGWGHCFVNFNASNSPNVFTSKENRPYAVRLLFLISY